MIEKYLLSITLVVILVVALIFRPVPMVEESKALVVEGVVDTIYGFGSGDIVFRLKQHQTRYYINRGEERGLNLAALRAELTHQHVAIKYPKYWTPLDWNNSVRHLSKLESHGRVLFNELK